MLACRRRPHHLATFSCFSVPSARSTSTSTSTSSTLQPADKLPDSIFTAPESPWDHVFSDVELPPAPRPRSRAEANVAVNAGLTALKKQHGPTGTQPLVQRASSVRRRRASLTAREMSVFEEMFDLIFNAASGKDGKAGSSAPGMTSSVQKASSADPLTYLAPSFSGQTPGIGRTSAGAPLDDLFRTLRRQSSRVRWTTAIDEELDRKKETMELFNTDHGLLQWVTLELFGEPKRWGEAATGNATPESATQTHKEGGGKTNTSVDGTALPSTSGSDRGHAIDHSIYPHLIAHAMRLFRTTYSNPSLSLAIFNHAARVSIPSYVFGCTAPAYNELIEAKWEGWGDLEGVCNALGEMRANGVKVDGRTRIVAEQVRREVGEARPSESKDEAKERGGLDAAKVNPLARRVWEVLGEAEVMRLLHRIEQLALRERARKSASSPHKEPWKNAVLEPAGGDGWRFDGWGKDAMKPRRGASMTSRDKARPEARAGLR